MFIQVSSLSGIGRSAFHPSWWADVIFLLSLSMLNATYSNRTCRKSQEVKACDFNHDLMPNYECQTCCHLLFHCMGPGFQCVHAVEVYLTNGDGTFFYGPKVCAFYGPRMFIRAILLGQKSLFACFSDILVGTHWYWRSACHPWWWADACIKVGYTHC